MSESDQQRSPDDDTATALDDAIAFEKQHRSPISRDVTTYLEDPIEETTVHQDDDDDAASDMPIDPRELGVALAACSTLPGEARRDELNLLERYRDEDKARKARNLRDLPADVNPHDLQQTGWGLILPAGPRGDSLRHTLGPLLARRSEQAEDRYVDDLPPYRLGTDASEYLEFELEIAPGVVDMDRVPYYLLIVGGPELVPFSVQYALAVNRAVGRIAFDKEEDYARWAQSVVNAERHGVSRPRRGAMLTTEDGSRAMRTLGTHLVDPLKERLDDYMEPWPVSARWPLDVHRGAEADKAGMLHALAGEQAPALALIAAHGLPLLPDNPHQKRFQGAVCCQRTTGDKRTLDRLLVASDIDALATPDNPRPLQGLTAFLFACYGAGTPREDDFPQVVNGQHVAEYTATPGLLADASFMAALPQAMLRQGALAVVGHVDRGWTLSFAWTLSGRTTDGVRSLEESIKQLVRGHRLGHALRALNRRHNAIASHLNAPLDQHRRGKTTDQRKLALQWTAHHDARNFILLGDPAVYLGGQRTEGPGFCCDQWSAKSASPPVFREWPVPSPGTIVLPPDLQRHVEREANARGIDAGDYVAALVQQHVAAERVLPS